ncbi:MAG: thioredoxin family protein [Xanthomonadales bacterium]|jgi:peroxiredoxin|nr:thioredoxin family protein [Xanthomonadales bacterium]
MALTLTPEPALGSSWHDFKLPGTDGRNWSLAELRRPQGLLLAFICNHCPYVQAIHDRLVRDLLELQALGFGVAAISSNDAQAYPQDSFPRMRELAQAWGFGFPYLYDENQVVARAYGAVCTPDFFGYDAEGRLVYRGRLDAAARGPRPPGMARELVDAMRRVAAGERPSGRQQPSMGCSIKWKPA